MASAEKVGEHSRIARISTGTTVAARKSSVMSLKRRNGGASTCETAFVAPTTRSPSCEPYPKSSDVIVANIYYA